MPRTKQSYKFALQVRFNDGRPAHYIQKDEDGTLILKRQVGLARLYSNDPSDFQGDAMTAANQFKPCEVFLCSQITGTQQKITTTV